MIVLAAALFVVTATNAVLACRSLFPAPCRPTIMSAANDPQEVAYMRGTAPMEAGAFPVARYAEAAPARDRQAGGK